MNMSFQCPNCGRGLHASSELAGKSARCAGCGTTFRIPSPTPDGAEDSSTQPCPQCGKPLQLTRKLRGHKIRCGGCHTALRVSAETWDLSVEGPAPAMEAKPMPPVRVPQAASASKAADPPPLPDTPFAPESPAAPDMPATPDPPAFDDPLGLGTSDLGPPLPRPQAARRRLKVSMPLVLGIGGGVLGLLLVGSVLAFVLLRSGAAGASAMRYMPDSATVIVFFDVPGFLDSKFYKDMAARSDSPVKDFEKEMSDETGLRFSDFARITFGGDTNSRDAVIIVMELTKAVEKDKFLRSLADMEWREEKVGGLVMHACDRRGTSGVHFPNGRTVVIGAAGELRKVLERGRVAEFSPPLAEASKQLDLSQTLALAMVGAENLPLPLEGTPVGPETLKGIRAFTVQAKVDADVRMAATLMCRDADTADRIQKMADGAVAAASQTQMPKEAKQILETVKITRSDATVHAKLTMGADILMPAIQAARGASARTRAPAPKFSDPRSPPPE